MELYFNSYDTRTKAYDLAQLRDLINMINEYHDADLSFLNAIIFNVQANFQLGIFVNFQSCLIYSSQNPHVVVKNQIHPQCAPICHN